MSVLSSTLLLLTFVFDSSFNKILDCQMDRKEYLYLLLFSDRVETKFHTYTHERAHARMQARTHTCTCKHTNAIPLRTQRQRTRAHTQTTRTHARIHKQLDPARFFLCIFLH